MFSKQTRICLTPHYKCEKGWVYAKKKAQSIITTALLLSKEIRLATVTTTVG